MNGSRGTLGRTYRLSDYLGLGQQSSITTDASPTRMGAWLMTDGAIEEFFSVEVTWIDQEVLDKNAGGSEGQQLWESLTVLIALHLWAPQWKERRIRLCVRSDNISALTMRIKMKSTGEGMGLIARELALDVAEALSQGRPAPARGGEYLGRLAVEAGHKSWCPTA